MSIQFSISLLATYLIGAIPFGLLFARWLTDKDPREHGSGNIGATNALRTGGKKVGILTLAADVFKGVIPVALALQFDFSQSQVLLIALAAFFGHVFPVYLKFKGGKGVATMFGVLLPWIPLTTVITFVAWVVVFKVTRYVSIASIAAGFSLPLAAWLLHDSDAALVACLVIGGAVTIRHHGNVSRLIAGTETKT